MSALIPLLVCGGGMAVCMLMMGRMHRGTGESAPPGGSPAPDDVAELRGEVERLRAELRDRHDEHRA